VHHLSVPFSLHRLIRTNQSCPPPALGYAICRQHGPFPRHPEGRWPPPKWLRPSAGAPRVPIALLPVLAVPVPPARPPRRSPPGDPLRDPGAPARSWSTRRHFSRTLTVVLALRQDEDCVVSADFCTDALASMMLPGVGLSFPTGQKLALEWQGCKWIPGPSSVSGDPRLSATPATTVRACAPQKPFSSPAPNGVHFIA